MNTGVTGVADESTTAVKWPEVKVAGYAVLLVLLLLYAAPTFLYQWVGVRTAERWAEQMLLGPRQASDAFKCPTTQEVRGALPARRDMKRAPKLAQVSSNKTAASSATAVAACKELTPVEQAFLNHAEEWLIKVGEFHLGVARDLFKWQYLATLSGLAAGTLTAAALLVISLQGLPKATLWMKSVFVVCSASAAFWVAVPQLYRYAENQSAALKGYSLATNALWQVRAARAGSLDGEGKWADGAKFVSALPAKLAEIGALSLSFDESKMKIADLKALGT